MFSLHITGLQIKKPSIGTPPPNTCPVCGIQLAPNELESHFLTELDRLYKLSCGVDRTRIRTNFNISSLMHSNNGGMQPGTDSRWEVSGILFPGPNYVSIRCHLHMHTDLPTNPYESSESPARQNT